MKAIETRLRRLEEAADPIQQKPSIADVIEARRKRWMGADYKLAPRFPLESYAGCNGIAECMIRYWQLKREQKAQARQEADERSQER